MQTLKWIMIRHPSSVLVLILKVEEKRANFSLRQTREREKFPIQKKRKDFSLKKLRKLGEREEEKVVLLFSSTLLILPGLRTQCGRLDAL